MPHGPWPRKHAPTPTFTFTFQNAQAMTFEMKAFLTSIVLAGAGLVFVSCESDVPPDRTAPRKFQNGPLIDGTLSQPDRSEDPVIRENTRVGY
jgi:hypothetical protein